MHSGFWLQETDDPSEIIGLKFIEVEMLVNRPCDLPRQRRKPQFVQSFFFELNVSCELLGKYINEASVGPIPKDFCLKRNREFCN